MITKHALTERTSSYEFLWTEDEGDGGGLTADYYINYLQLSLWIVELIKSNVISVILLLNFYQKTISWMVMMEKATKAIFLAF